LFRPPAAARNGLNRFYPLWNIINPATKYVVFSQRVSVRSKAWERRFSQSKASSDNAAAGRHAVA